MRNIFLFIIVPMITWSQEEGLHPVIESLDVEYIASFNLRFDREAAFRIYRCPLAIRGHQSWFYMTPATDSMQGSATSTLQELRMATDSLMRVWKDFENDRLIFLDQALTGRHLKYADTLHPMSWTLQNQKRTIDGIECYRAESWFRGRFYTAWYAPSIPIANGPWKLGGLPGLIIEAEDSGSNLIFRLTSLKKVPQQEDFSSLFTSHETKDYPAFQQYWRQAFEKLRRSLAAQSAQGCLSCHTSTQMKMHSWEIIAQ